MPNCGVQSFAFEVGAMAQDDGGDTGGLASVLEGFRLDGKRALVTGGGKGLGLVMAPHSDISSPRA